MSKKITSPVKQWAGSVTIADPLTLPQAQAIEAAMEGIDFEGKEQQVVITLLDEKKQPAIMLCVEKWELDNFNLCPDGTPPASPRLESHKLREWLFFELAQVYFGELIVPNESSPTPTDTPAPDTTPPK